jgi:hypothetical protein
MDRLTLLASRFDTRWIRIGWMVVALALAAVGLAADEDGGF